MVLKGEVVLLVGGAESAQETGLEVDRLRKVLSGKLPDKEIAKAVAEATGAKRNELYKRLLEIAPLRSQ